MVDMAFISSMEEHLVVDGDPRRVCRDMLLEDGKWKWDTLLRMVLERPHLDSLRLLCADWLMEQPSGILEERAKLIQYQIQLAWQRDPKKRRPKASDSDSDSGANDVVQELLERVIKSLLDRHLDKFLAYDLGNLRHDLLQMFRANHLGFGLVLRYNRGFIEEVEVVNVRGLLPEVTILKMPSEVVYSYLFNCAPVVRIQYSGAGSGFSYRLPLAGINDMRVKCGLPALIS